MGDQDILHQKSLRQQALERPLNIDIYRTALAEESNNEKKIEALIQKSNIYASERHGQAITGLFIASSECSYEWGNKYKLSLKSTRPVYKWSPALTRRGAMLVLLDPEPPADEIASPTFQATVIGGSPTHIEVLVDAPVPLYKVHAIQGTSDVPYARMNAALQEIQVVNSYLSESIVLGETKQTFQSTASLTRVYNKNLDASQLDAVRFALKEPISVIHGPPGTGKTSTIVEIILQFCLSGKRILVCAASNAAVDNIIVRTKPYFRDGALLRMGHPGRISAGAASTSLEIKKGKVFGTKRKTKKIRKKMEAYVANKLQEAQIVFGTLHASGADVLKDLSTSFDVVIIDEVSQATLAQAIVPICTNLGVTQLVLAGDPKQLPPTILNNNPNVKQVLEVTLFDLLESYYGEKVIKLLNTQYRMSDAIMRFSAEQMYDDLLKAAESVHYTDLHDLRDVRREAYFKAPIVFVDTNGLHPEEKDNKTKSTRNAGEAELVHRYASRLLRSGLRPAQIGVITPYGAQTALVKQLLPHLDVSTVDGFQGQEREVIIMTMVRSNANGQIGFLGDERRLNVAITRAKKHLCVIGDSSTLSSGTMLKEWTKHLRERHSMRCPDTMFDSGMEALVGGMAQIVI